MDDAADERQSVEAFLRTRWGAAFTAAGTALDLLGARQAQDANDQRS